MGDVPLYYNIKKEFINFLIQSDVLTFGEFITKSKRKTPYFINTGNFKTAKQISILGKFYADFLIQTNASFDVLFGPAYKGIPLVLSCCHFLYLNHNVDKPFFFNRKEKKDHGEKGSFIGYSPEKGDVVAIIEDVLTAGTAIKEVLPMIKNSFDVTIKDMFILVDRCEVASNSVESARKTLEKDFNIKINSLVNIKDILEFLEGNEKFKQYRANIKDYISQYCVF